MTRMAALCAALAALSLAGCADGLRFEKDDRLRFIEPGEGAEVATPLRLRWTVEGFRPAGRDGSSSPRRGLFAVFVDRSPVAPGEPVEAVAREDPLCERAPGCPDEAWLADRGVHVTAKTELLLPALPDDGGVRADDGRRHEITVVLLDGRGRRIGESAWTRTVYAPEGGAS